MSRTKLIGIFVLVLVAASPGELRAEGVLFTGLQIPAAFPGSQTFALEAIVVRPDDGAPHPLALLNHGSPRASEDRATKPTK